MKYLVNAFSLNMMKELSDVTVTLHIKKLSAEEFCREISTNAITNAIGHASTVNVINTLCGASLSTNRIEVKLQDGDELILFQVRKRLEEGKVLSADEVRQLILSNLVEFLEVKVKMQ
ncbi:MAG: DUF1874 domain-containing protein [Desulfurococcaceae archaeon]